MVGRLPVIPAFVAGAVAIDQLKKAQDEHGQLVVGTLPEVLDLLGYVLDVDGGPIAGADRRGLGLRPAVKVDLIVGGGVSKSWSPMTGRPGAVPVRHTRSGRRWRLICV
jgi:hypothetical protein